MLELNLASSYAFSDGMILDVYMLCLLVKLRVLGQHKRAKIVSEDLEGLRWEAHFFSETFKPDCISIAVIKSDIFSFACRSGDG